MSTAYLSRLPREFMRIAAGFSHTAGNYHLQRAAVRPSAALTSRIWPWVDGWLARYNASIVSSRSYADGGLDDCDIAGKQFLDLLAWLRIVMPQDAAILQHRFLLFPLWQNPIFCDQDWAPFCARCPSSAQHGRRAHRHAHLQGPTRSRGGGTLDSGGGARSSGPSFGQY